MNDFVFNIPPHTEEECLDPELHGLLEIEVSHLSFITSSSSSSLSSNVGKFPCSVLAKKKNKETSCLLGTSETLNNSACENIELNHNIAQNLNKKLSFKFQRNDEKVKSIVKSLLNNPNTINCVQVKIVWFGERKEDAANLCISCESQQHPTTLANTDGKDIVEESHHIRKQKTKRILLQPSLAIKNANNTLRYRVCTRKALLLDYLRSCKPIQIIVTSISSSSSSSSNSNSHCLAEPLGQAQFRLPQVLIKKFAFNIGKGHNFEHKTKIYALYQKIKKKSCSNYLPEYNLQSTSSIFKQKSGEIQLRFRMLFAPSAAVTAVAAASSASLTTKRHAINVLHDKQLTSSPLQHHHHHNCHHRHHPHLGKPIAQVAEHVSVQGDKSKRISTLSKAEEIVEAMKKLDAKLVAYLAGETEIASKLCEEENAANLNLETTITTNECSSSGGVAVHLDDLSPATKLNIFKNIKGIKIEMEALTLQPEGTMCMNLLQNEIRPIFTVECQLSNELIKNVPRHDMFHIMQFESEKFHSLTQCTRFGQEVERHVQLDVDENGNTHEMNLGRIYFTVWWREPGTCLNEMLGMGILEISDLYNASLLEQCKCIEIKRRGNHLACLYFKLILQRDAMKMKSSSLSSKLMKRELFLPKQSSCDSGDEKSPKATDRQRSPSNSQPQQQPNQATTCGNLSTDKASTDKASAHNNNTKLQTTNFDDETAMIRLLKGLVYANETRFLEQTSPDLQKHKFLICRRFWLDEPAAAKADELNQFNYQEQFSIINDEKFLQRADKQFLHLELWHRLVADDGNGNLNYKIQPMGVVNIPLHQFYIAYRDAAITNHLCKGKLPVISIDAWTPIINCETGTKIGDLKCLLAVGSEEQIKNLKDSKGLCVSTCNEVSTDLFKKEEFHILKPLQIAMSSRDSKTSTSQSCAVKNNQAVKIRKTSDLMDMLQKALMTSPSATSAPTTSANAYHTSGNERPAMSSSPLKPLQPSNIKLFKFSLEVQRALGLPLNPAAKGKKGSKHRNSSKRFPPNEPPSTYVTFQADEGQYQTYKSHEGMVFATNIIEKNTQPQWQQRFRLAANVEYLRNPQKRFILKVWKKSALDMAQGQNQPTPMEDAIMGFAALDLSVFMRGLHIGGRFNIVDFNGRINGQLEIRCQPLDDIPATNSTSSVSLAYLSPSGSNESAATSSTVDSVIDQFEETLDLTHLNLGQAIKRKFTELEGISDRLRARLGDVTGTEMSKSFNMEQFDNWQPLEKELGGDNKDGNEFDEFERDLNTPTEDENEEKSTNQGNCERGGMSTTE